MSKQKTSKDTGSATFSLESEDGRTPSDSLDGTTIGQSAPALAHVSRSLKQAKGKWTQTSATFGPLFEPSSPSESFQLSLESKLHRRMAAYGSPEYELTWKRWDMCSGPQICALRASPRRWSVKGCIGWPRPRANKWGMADSHGFEPTKAILQGLCRPTAEDGERGKNSKFQSLDQQARILGWQRPTAVTDTGGAALCKWGGTASRERLREAVGNTVLNGALNPAFPCWLMGFPDGWLNCADSAMRSYRNSRRNSSKPTSKQNAEFT